MWSATGLPAIDNKSTSSIDPDFAVIAASKID
jgi:hypothetical protein